MRSAKFKTTGDHLLAITPIGVFLQRAGNNVHCGYGEEFWKLDMAFDEAVAELDAALMDKRIEACFGSVDVSLQDVANAIAHAASKR